MNRSTTFMAHQHFSKRIIRAGYTFPSKSNVFDKKRSANHKNSKKSTTSVFNKRSVTYMRKYPITQYVVSNSGDFTKERKRGGTTRICKTMKYRIYICPYILCTCKNRGYTDYNKLSLIISDVNMHR